MKLFDEDGCLFHARRKYDGELAEYQHEEELKWAQQLAETVKPIAQHAVTLPQRLRSCIQNGRLVVVTGAGVSMSCGLPSWHTLVNEAAREILRRSKLIEEEVESMLVSVSFANDLLSFSQALRALSSEGDLAAVIASLLYANNPKPSTFLKSVVSLIKSCFVSNRNDGQPTIVLTFNYDILLEEALNHAGLSVESVDRNIEIEHFNTNVVHVVHVHGILRRKESGSGSIIFTEQSYGDAYLRAGCADPLSSILDAQLTPLFVGFSFRDHLVRQIVHKFSIKRDETVAVALIGNNDLFDIGRLRMASPYRLGFSLNDKVGWQKTGKNPMSVRYETLIKIPEHLARWILYSVGVEWWSVANRDGIPKALAEISK